MTSAAARTVGRAAVKRLTGIGPNAFQALAAAGIVGTRLLTAWQSYEAGHDALAEWNLDGAERGFRDAIQLDPEYPHANLWLAQTLAWAGRPVPEWRPYAMVGGRSTNPFGFHDRSLSRALVRLANEEKNEIRG